MSVREIAAFSTELVAAYRRNEASRDVVLRVQRERTATLLGHARRLPRWRNLTRLEDADVLDKPTLMNDLQASLLGPAETSVRAFLQRGQPASLLDDRYIVATTSGTTGEVGVFVTDDAAFARLRATIFARLFRGQLKPEGFALLAKRRYRLSFIVATGSHTMTTVLAQRMPKMGKLAADVRVLDVEMPLAELVRALNAAPPMLLHSYATVLELLAHEQRAGRLRIAPEIVTAGSEPLTIAARRSITSAFAKASVLETWAATEHVALATSCALGHMHHNEDVAAVEPVDAQMRPMPDGEWGEHVLITNLLNTTQPLLRYRLDDRVRVVAGVCACGSPFRRLEVEGRTDDTIYLDDGATFQAHTPIPWEIALLGAPGLRQFQLVHTRQNELHVYVVVEGGHDGDAVVRDVTARVERYLGEHGLFLTTRLVVERTAALSRNERSGKLRQIMSMVEKPASFVPAPTVRSRRP